jgi:NitT/TauT family transport system substrate-binding protein
MKIFKVTVLVLFALALFFSGCSQKPETVKVGYITIADCAQLYVGIEKGFFKEEGLIIEPVGMAGGAKILEALSATTNPIDIGFSNVVSLILARDAGLNFIALTGGPIEDSTHKEHAILVKNDSPIKVPQDLRGKTIALNTRKNIDEIFVREYLEKNGVNSDEVTFIEIPFPNMESVLLSGDVDAVAAIEPFVSIPLLHGNTRVLDYNYLILEPKVEISTYVVSETWLKNNKKIAERFIRAFNKATDYAIANENEVRTIITKYTKIDEKQAQQIEIPTFGKKLSATSLQGMADKVYKRGWIKTQLNVSTIIYSE